MVEELINWRVLEAQILDVKSELERASKKFGKFNTAHEGYAIIKEELEELWEAIKTKPQNQWEMRQEAIQLCAMALRFINDITPILGPV